MDYNDCTNPMCGYHNRVEQHYADETGVEWWITYVGRYAIYTRKPSYLEVILGASLGGAPQPFTATLYVGDEKSFADVQDDEMVEDVDHPFTPIDGGPSESEFTRQRHEEYVKRYEEMQRISA